jgi:hypothetical protein
MKTQLVIQTMIPALFMALGFLMAMWWNRSQLASAAQAIRETAVLDVSQIAAGHVSMGSRMTEIERSLNTIRQVIVPISMAFQEELVNDLTHFHTPEMDELMKKLGPPPTLTGDEEARLEILLDERTRDMGDKITAEERDAARMLPFVVRRAKAATSLDRPTVFRLVYVIQPGEERKSSRGAGA